MDRVTYRIARHEDGWAYRVGDVWSETFATEEAAREAAEIAASEQERAGADEHVEYEDADGVWHDEEVSGMDRPDTEVEE